MTAAILYGNKQPSILRGIISGILVSLSSSVPFVAVATAVYAALDIEPMGGGCGGMAISPCLGLIIALITGAIGSFIGIKLAERLASKNIGKNIILVVSATFCGAVGGFLAAYIFAFNAC